MAVESNPRAKLLFCSIRFKKIERVALVTVYFVACILCPVTDGLESAARINVFKPGRQ
jgi:hypothetical protein